MKIKKKHVRKGIWVLAAGFVLFMIVVVAGYMLPFKIIMPVRGATTKDYNHKSYWYYPWGKSGVHKGVDIFAKKGTDVLAATSGIVMEAHEIDMGGNIILILGPKWRYHYYAHLKDIKVKKYQFVNQGDVIGTVGDSGNAKGKPPHLHYAIITPVPYYWLRDTIAPQGDKKMYYLDPIKYLEDLE